MGFLSGKPKPSVQTIIEPLGLMLVKWCINRIVGDERKCREVIEAFQSTSVVHSSLHELIGKSTGHKQVALISSQELPLLGERRVIEVGGKAINAIIGLPEELKTFVNQRDFHSEALVSLEHGLLPLVVASSASTKEGAKFNYLGTLLLEPAMQEIKTVRENARFLSALPARFLAYFYPYVGAYSDLYVDTRDFLYQSPQEIDKIINQAAVIGGANFRERYQILALIGVKNPYHYLSRNIQDEQLPGQLTNN